ncbi:MAG: hypothetical protein QOJ70_1126 [Acidobacteriota bacterium]|jgi:hypothetical protein|nr:hypothetical protein [Acidobacteriota bacterium]
MPRVSETRPLRNSPAYQFPERLAMVGASSRAVSRRSIYQIGVDGSATLFGAIERIPVRVARWQARRAF